MSRNGNKIFGSIEAAKKIGIEVHRLYSWERCGVVTPVMKTFETRQFRRYSLEDIDRGLFVKALVDEEGYTLKTAVCKLELKISSDI